MFTGIIHGQGLVQHVLAQGDATRLQVQALYALPDIVRGESIAVNGVCLTVENFGKDYFMAYASAVTMQCTNLGQLRSGSHVNLERALAVGDRLGGHIVSGHVDCTGAVVHAQLRGQSHVVRIAFPKEYATEIIPKGSVTLDGISLTITDCGCSGGQCWFAVNIIPETWHTTTIQQWQAGYPVNIETDIVGKYVRNMLQPWHMVEQQGVNEAFLRQHGFI